MIYIKWFFLLIVNISTNYLVNWPLAPLVVLFASEDGWLPQWLWWFQTPDSNLDGSVERSWEWKRPYPKQRNAYQRWVNRFSWLHRNKLYGFSEAVLGVKYDRREVYPIFDDLDYAYHTSLISQTYQRFGSREVRNVPKPGKSGIVKRFLWDSNGKMIAWQFYYIRQWKRWPNKCIRLNAGWKLWSWEDHKSESASFVFSPSPWMTFTP